MQRATMQKPADSKALFYSFGEEKRHKKYLLIYF